jgi:hypothetical protein
MSKQECGGCGDHFEPVELTPYKYEPSVKLCENCLESWMDDSNDGEVD